MIGALIGAAGSLLGGALNRRADREAMDQQAALNDRSFAASEHWNQQSLDLARESFDWQKAHIQNRVADARKAGIHPLYALGAPGAGASFTAGGSPTGSALSTGASRASGIGEAVSTIGRAIGGRAQRAQAARMMEAQIATQNSAAARNNAEALYAASRTKRLEQEMNATGVGRAPVTEAFAIGAKPSRGLEVEDYRNIPADITAHMPGGNMQLWNPDVMGEGADYINAWRRFQRALGDSIQRAFGRRTPSERRAYAHARIAEQLAARNTQRKRREGWRR